MRMRRTRRKMPIVKPWSLGATLQVFVFSMYKAGKTWGAGTFPRPNFIDTDGGTAVLGSSAWRQAHPVAPSSMFERFKELNVNKKTGIITDHNAYDDCCRYFDACMSQKTIKWRSTSDGQLYDVNVDMFDTWVVDSLTSLSELAMNKAIVLLGKKEFSATSATHAQAKQFGMVYPKIQDYGSERSLVEQFVDMVRDSGKNVVVLAHEKEVTNSLGQVTAKVPLVTGKSVQAISAKFDEIYSIRSKRVDGVSKRVLVTQDEFIKVGSRYGLPNGTEWSYEAITKALVNLNNPTGETK
jgi:hypothetical protein